VTESELGRKASPPRRSAGRVEPAETHPPGAAASGGKPTAGSGDSTVRALEASAQRPAMEQRAPETRGSFKRQQAAAVSGPSLRRSTPPRQAQAKAPQNRCRIPEEQVFVSSGKRLPGAQQLLVAPAATLQKLRSRRARSSPPPSRPCF